MENQKDILADAQRLRQAKKYKYCILLPDDPIKVKWDLFVTALLFFTFVATPYRLAFYATDNSTWIIIDSVIDFAFFIDIILNFFMAFYNQQY